MGARPLDPDDGPDHARGEGHARARSGRCAPRRCGRSPGDPTIPSRRRGLRLPGARRRRQGRPRAAPASRSPASPPASRRARRSATSSSPRRGRRSRRAPTRSTWSSTGARSCRATTPPCSTRSSTVKEAAGAAHLKVILETGELETLDNVRRASVLAMAAGADFIKTSTGKVDAGRHAPGHARDARGDPRLRARDRPPGRA